MKYKEPEYFFYHSFLRSLPSKCTYNILTLTKEGYPISNGVKHLTSDDFVNYKETLLIMFPNLIFKRLDLQQFRKLQRETANNYFNKHINDFKLWLQKFHFLE